MQMQESMRRQTPSDQRGFILVVALCLLFIVSMMGLVAANLGTTESYLASNHYVTRQAFYSAEAGVYDGITRLVKGTITDTTPSVAAWNAGSTYSSSGFANSFTVRHLLDASGTSVVTNAAGNPYYVIRSTGWESSAKRGTKVVEEVISLLITITPAVAGGSGLIGCNGITVTGSGLIDSYNSGNGTYASQATNTDALGNTYAGDYGSMTTCTASANINFTANAPIHGDLSATGTVNPPGGGAFFGTEHEGIPTQTCDPLNIVSFLAGKWPSPATATAKILGTTSLSSPGSYHYQEIKLTGSETITITGTGTISLFVDGNISLTGANSKIVVPAGVTLNIYSKGEIDLAGQMVINNNGIPSMVNIYNSYADTGVVDHVKMTGSGAFYGTLYAPLANVRLSGSGDMHGSVRGRFLTKTGTAEFHADEAITGGGGSTGSSTITGYTRSGWREVNN